MGNCCNNFAIKEYLCLICLNVHLHVNDIRKLSLRIYSVGNDLDTIKCILLYGSNIISISLLRN